MTPRLGTARRRRFSFMLTPLVDVMFLLLLFFMLSSQTAPFGLLPVSAGAQTAGVAGPAAGAQRELVVSVGAKGARFNGRMVEAAQFGTAIMQAIADGYTTAYVATAPEARAQDLVDVIDRFKGAGFPRVLIVAAPGTGG